MKVTEQTKNLAQRVLDYWVLTNSHEQKNWVSLEGGIPKITNEVIANREMQVCNSTMCAAGTAVFLSVPNEDFMKMCDDLLMTPHGTRLGDGFDFEDAGAELLGLDDIERSTFYYKNNATVVDMMTAIAAGDKDKFEELLLGAY